jgi:DNA-binding Lrp family transcriptional regulator
MTKEQFIRTNLFRFIGCNCVNECPKTKSEDDLYLIGIEYFGRYEDDDCDFTYMNAKDGSIVVTTWTTRFAAPHFNTFLRMPVLDAIEAGYIDKKMVDDYIDAHWQGFKNQQASSIARNLTDMAEKVASHGKTLNIPCIVSNRCRKYKGDGILIRIVARHNPYNPWAKYPEYFAKVLGNDGNIHTVSAGSVTVDLELIRKKLTAMVSTLKDTEDLYSIFPMVNIDNELLIAVDIDHQARMEKYYATKAEKFPGLLEWCRKTKPEMDAIALRDWAERIYHKNNPLPILK